MTQSKHTEYSYTGTKLAKQVYEQDRLQSSTQYCGAFVYEDDAVSYLLFSEGRLLYKGNNTWKYEYHIEDHLGNVRVAFEPENNNKITQRNDYYPFGMQIQYNQFEAPGTNKYLYNGKEMQDEFGLDWLDYGARFYDAEIGRWHVVDPLAEEFISLSPYHYVYNCPVNGIDPDGRGGILTVDEDDNAHITFNLHLYAGENVDQESILSALGDNYTQNENGQFVVNYQVDSDASIEVQGNKRSLKSMQILIDVVSEEEAAQGLEENDQSHNYFKIVDGGSDVIGGHNSDKNKNTGQLYLSTLQAEEYKSTNFIGHEMWHTTGVSYKGNPGDHSSDNRSIGANGNDAYSGSRSVTHNDLRTLQGFHSYRARRYTRNPFITLNRIGENRFNKVFGGGKGKLIP